MKVAININCNVLRNSEGIENFDLKYEAYQAIIKYNLSFAILYTQWVIRYVIEHQRLPASIPPFVTLEDILTNMPYHMQHSIYQHMGTTKLSNIIAKKINNDKKGLSSSKSEIESFLSVALYSDVNGNDFGKVLKEFIKRTKTYPVKNYLSYKLMAYYYKRTRPGSSNEKLYIDLLTELRIRSQKLPRRVREQIAKTIKDQKDKISGSFN